MALVPANMPRLSFGPCKKKICFWSLQNRIKNKFFFYRDQNLNEAYLQGRVQYLSLKKIVFKRFYKPCQTQLDHNSFSSFVFLLLLSINVLIQS